MAEYKMRCWLERVRGPDRLFTKTIYASSDEIAIQEAQDAVARVDRRSLGAVGLISVSQITPDGEVTVYEAPH